MMAEALDSLPEKYVSGMENVLISFEAEPSPEQRERLRLGHTQTLFGLFTGVPRTHRYGHLSVPDAITLFKVPLCAASVDEADLKEQIRHTLWHEIAHYFGLDHPDIEKLESKRSPNA